MKNRLFLKGEFLIAKGKDLKDINLKEWPRKKLSFFNEREQGAFEIP